MAPITDMSHWTEEQSILIISNTVCCSIQRDLNQCGLQVLRKKMLNDLWDLFDMETRGIPAHTVNQISVIMRFLEIQWQHLDDDIHRDT